MKLTNLPSSTFGYFGALLNKDDQGPLGFIQKYVAGAFADFYEDTYRFFRIHCKNFDAPFKEDISYR